MLMQGGKVRSCYNCSMKTLNIGNLPDETVERLRIMAKESGCTMREIVLSYIDIAWSDWEFEKSLREFYPPEHYSSLPMGIEHKVHRDRDLQWEPLHWPKRS